MFFTNARIFCPDFQFHDGGFEVIDGHFGSILPSSVPSNAVDLHGAVVIPGLVDIHTHGASGADFSDADYAGLTDMARFLARQGVTSFAPASMTLPAESLQAAFSCAAAFHRNAPEGCARLMGIHMEGPYLSGEKKGAQNADFLKAPDWDEFINLHRAGDGLVRIVDIAPELPGALDFASRASQLCTVSAAHTGADYAQAKELFDAGASHLTHLFNAMSPIHHRNPGVIPAAVENEKVRAEVICDGYHVHPAAVRLAFSMFDSSRMILISDSGRCAGLPEDTYFTLGGQTAQLHGGVARLADGTIACSAANLWQCLCNAISWGISPNDAIRAATYNPACAISAQEQIGSIASGMLADFIVCTPDYTHKTVYLGGKAL